MMVAGQQEDPRARRNQETSAADNAEQPTIEPVPLDAAPDVVNPAAAEAGDVVPALGNGGGGGAPRENGGAAGGGGAPPDGGPGSGGGADGPGGGPPAAPDGLGSGPPPPNAVYSQQLWEVQLLLDFLSGNPAQRLPDPANARAAGLQDDWIEQICRMTWPPTGTVVEQADQEALLVRVKDYLNAMAAPASGFSVAFTLLVTQEDGTTDRRWQRKRRAEQGSRPPARPAVTESRGSLARKAYPDLTRKARTFRYGMGWIAVALTVWLAITCALSWYLALGNSELAQLATAQTAFDAIEVKIAAAQNAQSAGSAATSSGLQANGIPDHTGAKVAPDPLVQAAATSGVGYCDEPELLGTRQSQVSRRKLRMYVSPTQSDVCQAYDRSKDDLQSARANVQSWWPFGGNGGASGAVYFATALVSMLGAAILPVCYGILGAAAAVLRLLSRRMRLSLLTPRDLSLSVQQLALGAVIGACIGLFVASPGSSASTGSQLLGPVNLSTSALSFIAGFGVDSVFSTLEQLIARIFNTSPSHARSATS